MERIRTSLRFSESATAASNARALLVQFKNDPLFSVTAATGNTTSARSVTALGAISNETTKAFLSAVSVSAVLSKSCGSTPPTTSALISPAFTAEIISLVDRPIFAGTDATDHTLARSTRAAASETGRPPGSRFPIAPASSAPRSPARRGIQANFAPDCDASAATAESAPALSDARSPTKIIDCAVNDCEVIAVLSDPGATFTNVAPSFSTPIESFVPIDVTLSPRFFTCLFIRKKTIGDSSSGSKPTRST